MPTERHIRYLSKEKIVRRRADYERDPALSHKRSTSMIDCQSVHNYDVFIQNIESIQFLKLFSRYLIDSFTCMYYECAPFRCG